MFNKGEYVVYENAGVCKVEDITTIKMAGAQKDRLYYILHPVRDAGSSIYSPVDSDKVRIRKIMSREEADALLNEIPDVEELWIPNEKLRETRYKEAMHTGDGRSYVQIIKTLYFRRRERLAEKKKVTTTDERYLRMAEDALYSELSITLDMPKEKMEEYITTRIDGNVMQ